MSKETVIDFARRHRTASDYFYLLVDGQAECALDHPLSVPSLIRSFGEAAVTRVPRPDMSHEQDHCPALIQLATPGEGVSKDYLDLSADYSAWDLNYDERYICGWLTSREPLEVIAAHIAARCYTSADEAGDPSPWFEPLRLELLLCAMQKQAGCLLRPIQNWLLPLSWGAYTIARSPEYACDPELSERARQTQQLAPEVSAFLGIWRHALTLPEGFAPWRWKGPGILPEQASVHGFRLIRDARQLGLHNSSDRISLSLHRVFMHPLLPQHPHIQQAISQARAGSLDLPSHFATYSEATWKRIVYSLPLAKDYS